MVDYRGPFLAILLVVFSLAVSPSAHASGALSTYDLTNGKMKLTAYSTYLISASVVDLANPGGKVYGGAKNLCFTAATLVGGQATPQTFCAGPKGGNATLTAITSDHVELRVAFKLSETLYFNYSVPSQLPAGTEPSQVLYNDGNGQTSILTANFIASSVSFASCTGPCVYVNPSNTTLAIKSAALSPATVDIFIPVYSGSSSGPGGSGSLPTSGNTNSTLPQCSPGYFFNSTSQFCQLAKSPPSLPPVVSGVIPNGPLLFSIVGIAALFAVVGIAGATRGWFGPRAKKVENELTFAADKSSESLNFSAGLSKEGRKGPMMRRRKDEK